MTNSTNTPHGFHVSRWNPRGVFVGKALAFILRSVSLRLLEKFGIDCYVVRRIPKNLTESDDFSNFADSLL